MAASSVHFGSYWTAFLFLGYTCTDLGYGLVLYEEGAHYFCGGPCGAKISLIRCASKARQRRLSGKDVRRCWFLVTLSLASEEVCRWPPIQLSTGCASTLSARWQWTVYKRPTPGTQARPWRWRLSCIPSGTDSCILTQAIRAGSIVTVLSYRAGMPPSCSIVPCM